MNSNPLVNMIAGLQATQVHHQMLITSIMEILITKGTMTKEEFAEVFKRTLEATKEELAKPTIINPTIINPNA